MLIRVLASWCKNSRILLRPAYAILCLCLFGAVGLVLLIACANIVNLLLVRNAAREREVAVRTALGASPWRLIRQLLTESTLLSLLGGVLGVFFAIAGLRALMALVPADLAILNGTGLNGWVLGFTIAVCLATGLVCGLLPAARTLKTNLAGVLKQGSKGASSSGHHKTHNLLVISEIAMALVPLDRCRPPAQEFSASAGGRPRLPPRPHPDDGNPAARPFFRASQPALPGRTTQAGREGSLRSLKKLPRKSVPCPASKKQEESTICPLAMSFAKRQDLSSRASRFLPLALRPIAQTRTVSLRLFFFALAIPLRAGRYFNEDDWKVLNMVINENMARRYWPQGDALGKRVNFCSLDPKPCWFSVIGIVGNVHQFGLDAGPTFDAYFAGGWTPYLVVHTASDPVTVAAAITDVVHRVDPNLPITHITTMDGLLSDSVSPRRFSAVLVGIFAALALLLAAIGIYGVMSYTVSQRTQEIGLRMALGAQLTNVRGMILGQTLKLTLIGVGLGLAGAFVLARFLASLLFGYRKLRSGYLPRALHSC